MSDLVKQLTERVTPVEFGGSEKSLEGIRRRIEELRYVQIKFTATRGGTDLGVTVDPAATDLTGGDFVDGSGVVHIEGTLTLNYVPVRCTADIDLASLRGTGRLALAAHAES